jgi:signal transduction histidine kinase
VKGPEDFFKSRMEILETFARQISIAIRNVRDREIIRLLEQTLMETAHEFRSPLHNILTQVGSLKYILDKDAKQEKEIDEILKVIDEEATRASKQMANTLLYNDRSRGLMGFNFGEGFIQDLIQQCVSCYRLRALERGISIIIKDSIKKLPAFRFDKTKIEQVLNNLIDNAVKYSHYNRFIQIHGYDDGSKIHIEIWDKGQGIPEEEHDNIFEGFTRGSVKDKKRYIPGTGLGLKISREIVRGHGGEIKVKSTPFFDDPKKRMDYDGYDTTFTLILPKKPKGE